MNRSAAVLRMHWIDYRTLAFNPLIVLGLASSVVAAVFAVVPAADRETGAAASIYCDMIALAVLAVGRSMPFTLGMGVSRRAFALGTAGLAATLAVPFGTLVWLLGIVERDTGGWGGHAHMYYWPWLDSQGPVAWWFVAVTPVLAMFAIGAVTGAVYLRWGPIGLFGGLLSLLAAIGAAAVLITWQRAWSPIGAWLIERGPWEAVGLTAAVAVALAGLAWLALRRTTL